MAILNSAKVRFQEGGFDLITDTIKVALLTSSHVTNVDVQEFFDDVNANEVAGTGYAAGGIALGSKVITQDDANDKGVFDAADISWPTSTITARYYVLYKDTGDVSTSPIIGIFDFGSTQSSTSNDFAIQWSVNGILELV
jgi:hypothetical protein